MNNKKWSHHRDKHYEKYWLSILQALFLYAPFASHLAEEQLHSEQPQDLGGWTANKDEKSATKGTTRNFL